MPKVFKESLSKKYQQTLAYLPDADEPEFAQKLLQETSESESEDRQS